MSATPAILFLIFNRPDTTARVFEEIRRARPARLYVAADGPRAHREGEAERAAEARRIATAVDWPCEVQTLFREENLGCRRAVTAAISWFFEQEEEGVILEDDCLPDPSFFGYCAELLERYRHDERVMLIAGDFSTPFEFPADQSYVFSRFALLWGWACWRRSWRYYDFEDFRTSDWSEVLATVSSNRTFREWRETLCRETAEGRIDTWDYVWTYNIWCQSGLTVVPRVNLISNIGFGADATHTAGPDNPRAALPVQAIETPLRHPERVYAHPSFDASILWNLHGLRPKKTVPEKVKREIRRAFTGKPEGPRQPRLMSPSDW